MSFAESFKLPDGEGTVTFFRGPYGSGKTLLGVEVAREYSGQREQQVKGKVNVIFISGEGGTLLREQMEKKETGVQIESINEMLKTHCDHHGSGFLA